MSLDIAFPRNEKNWFEKLPSEIDDLIEIKLYYGHLFCHVMHQNYILKKGVDAKRLKQKLGSKSVGQIKMSSLSEVHHFLPYP